MKNLKTRMVKKMKIAKLCMIGTCMAAGMGLSCSQAPSKTAFSSQSDLDNWIFFFSNGKIGAIQPDGSGEHYIYFPEKNQKFWQLGGRVMPDHRRLILLSQDPAADPKAGFYGKGGQRNAPMHQWYYDFAAKSLHEIPIHSGIIAIMPGGQRFLVVTEADEEKMKTSVYTVNLDGTDKRNVHDLGGFCYSANLSPDGKNIVYHNSSEKYSIYALNLETGQKTLLSSEKGYLNFGPEWSPDGQWVLFQRCPYGGDDPYNSHSDLCIVRADGTEFRSLTTGQRQWFATSYGPGDNHGGGSNFPHWSPDGKWVTFTRCSEGAQTAWVYRRDRKDTDHFNCDYAPEEARGGSQICLINPQTGEIREVTPFQEKLWVWRTCWSPDSKQIVHARAEVGQNAELWIINADGSHPRKLTTGFESKGADFPTWLQLASQPQ
jgi:Tol biopolymer transport system component